MWVRAIFLPTWQEKAFSPPGGEKGVQDHAALDAFYSSFYLAYSMTRVSRRTFTLI